MDTNLITTVAGTSFGTSIEAFEQTKRLESFLGLSSHAAAVRIALGRSLGVIEPPKKPDSVASSKTIRGDILLGRHEDCARWVAILINSAANSSASSTAIAYQVKAHWHRGAALLTQDLKESEGDLDKFLKILMRHANLTPATAPSLDSASMGNIDTTSDDEFYAPDRNPAPIHIELGIIENDQEKFIWTVNGSGYSPHIALMGQAGSGKTLTMLKSLQQIRHQTQAPVLLLDLGKGDLANDKELARELDANVLRIPEQSVPLDMFYGSTEDTANSVLRFRESFGKVTSSKLGGIQTNSISEALQPIFSKKQKIPLEDIQKSLLAYYEDNQIKTDTVISTLNDLNRFRLFKPELTPQSFFSKSWIITFANAPDSVKNLTVYLLLDALNVFMKQINQAPTDANSHRAIRMLLAIDEARPLLAAKHKALSEIIRLHRSKGLVAALASQSPDDYDGQEDDYLENIGLAVCFKTNADATSVLKNMFGGKVNFSNLATGVCSIPLS